MSGRRKRKASHRPVRFQRSGALLQKLTEHAAVATFLVDMKGDLFYANRAFCDLLGYEPDEIIGLCIERIVHPDFAATARENIARLANGEIDGYQSERQYVRKNGETIWVMACGSVLRDEPSGRSLYLIVQAMDIGRQKRAEAAQVESESRWNFALEGACQGVWDHDFRNNRVFHSRMWRLMRGMDPDEDVDGSTEAWLSRVHPDDRERIRETVRRQDSGEISTNAFEYRERHRDGHWMWILSRGKPTDWFADGSAARFIGTDTDITSLKQTQAELAKEKERLRVTLQSIAEGVIATDANGCVTFMNPAAEQMTGWCSMEAIGRSIGDIATVVEASTGRTTVDLVAECMAKQCAVTMDDDVILMGRNAERRDVRDSAAPLRTPGGDVIGAVFVFQDVTASRALQRELAYSAMHDALTGLPNRLAFDRRLNEALAQAKEGREHALCFIDLDGFKKVNDTAGHAAGDALLQEIGLAIRGSCRDQDFAARIGGDEFAVVLGDCTLAGAKMVAQKIVDTIAVVRFAGSGHVFQVGASVGISPVVGDAPHASGLMSRADAACYAAKALGRNQIAVVDGHDDNPHRQSA